MNIATNIKLMVKAIPTTLIIMILASVAFMVVIPVLNPQVANDRKKFLKITVNFGWILGTLYFVTTVMMDISNILNR